MMIMLSSTIVGTMMTIVGMMMTIVGMMVTIVGNMLFDGGFSYRLCWKCGMVVQADMRYIITCMAGCNITATVDQLPRYHFHDRYTLSQAYGLDSCLVSALARYHGRSTVLKVSPDSACITGPAAVLCSATTTSSTSPYRRLTFSELLCVRVRVCVCENSGGQFISLASC